MQIRKATMNDLPDILAIYAYARKYMKATVYGTNCRAITTFHA